MLLRSNITQYWRSNIIYYVYEKLYNKVIDMYNKYLKFTTKCIMNMNKMCHEYNLLTFLLAEVRCGYN